MVSFATKTAGTPFMPLSAMNELSHLTECHTLYALALVHLHQPFRHSVRWLSAHNANTAGAKGRQVKDSLIILLVYLVLVQYLAEGGTWGTSASTEMRSW